MDLNEKSKLYAVSVELMTVSVGLEKLITEEELTEHEKLRFGEIGSLLCNLDYYSPYQHKSDASVVLATSVRPYFYNSLLEKRELWCNRKFLDNLYLTLESNGEKQLLSKRELGLASNFLEKISCKILSDIRRQYKYEINKNSRQY